ncbi:hypothetical protein B7486_63100 [cyanobacterium TDX16]|nr:hypothetical protein B7486_63100 [cyanobacterium TDX16]
MITGTIRLFFWLLLLPLRLAWALVKGTLKLGVGTAKGGFKLGVGTGKVGTKAATGIGLSRIAFFGIGIAVGYLLGAPTARQRLFETIQGLTAGPPSLGPDSTVPLPRPNGVAATPTSTSVPSA